MHDWVLAGFPFFGLWYPYGDYKNPWKNADYNNYRCVERLAGASSLGPPIMVFDGVCAERGARGCGAYTVGWSGPLIVC